MDCNPRRHGRSAPTSRMLAAGGSEENSKLITRVRKYLSENKDKVYVDVSEIADYLQMTYRSYQRRKRGSFRIMVRRAYDEITECLTQQDDSIWPDEVNDIDIEIDTSSEYEQAYEHQDLQRPGGNSDDNELINISSDDDQVNSSTIAMTMNDEIDVGVEMISDAKRPHLRFGEESSRTSDQQMQDQQVDSHLKFSNRVERSRKRHRDKDIANNFDNYITKRKAKGVPVVKPTVKFSDMGGITKVLEVIANLLVHMKHPEVYSKIGISPPTGFLLYGPPGCGKTTLAHAIAGELNIPLLKISAIELDTDVSRDSEQCIRELFEQAVATAPCVLFFDEIDAVSAAPKEEKKRIVSQLLFCLDELARNSSENKVLVIGATSKPDSIDPAFRRPGRFDREVSLGIPDKEARAAILEVQTSRVNLSPDLDLHRVASLTSGFVGADLVALVRAAAMAAVNRTVQDLKKSPSTNDEIYITVSEVLIPSNENAVIEVEKEKQPVLNKDIENPDIIIEEDPPTQTDPTEKPKEDKADAAGEAVRTASMEEQKATEETPDISQPSKSPPTEPIAPSPTTTTEGSQVESSVSTQLTDLSAPSPKESEQPAPAVVSDETVSDSEPMKMQVEEEKKSDNNERLAELLAWLQNDLPLTTEQLSHLCIKECDFEVAFKNVQPSAKREGFATVPNVTWEDVGSLHDIRQELQMTILAPIKYAERFENFGLSAPTGVLLCGPPGCGKTLLAKAIANEAAVSFISVKGSELLNTVAGESEKAIRQCFSLARNSTPCIVFFDELDALCPRRAEGDFTATSRVVNQMLTEMDGVEGRRDFFIMAASNRPEMIDPAVLRHGRLHKILYVGIPNALDRVHILRALTKNGMKPQLAKDVRLEEIAEKSEGFTGADLAALVREACIENLRETMAGLATPAEICPRHFHEAFAKVRPSLQEKDIRYYDKLQKLFAGKKNQIMDVPMSLDPPIDTTMEAMET